MKYKKPALTVADQINLLKSRNLVISDTISAEKFLSNISYYRLSGYLYPFKDLATDKFDGKVTFEEIIDLYLFDRDLRLLIFDAIETIEVVFRTQMIYHPSMKSGGFWFEDVGNFENSSRHTEHLRKLDEEVERSKSEVYLDHFFRKYDEEQTPPAWMTFEVLSLGLLSKFYQNIRRSLPEKKAIAKHFGVLQPAVFQSWIRSVTYVRNICAHHSRLWNRILTNKPIIPHTPPKVWISDVSPNNEKIYFFLCCLAYMVRNINPETIFIQRLKKLLADHPNVSKRAMGFPDKWESEDFWK